ncbi:type III-B CRISPR module RAMP protein Cmr6 [Arcicella sp. DC2W]|uniref:Type III-B CRISPR module RAMP protein Cmr6 n=1 Tax=Arcicella gelida TaxID=2984195 RepID=A0ABU5S3F7_9BACT|nr:type III-B CRISPR module RAMP protein Cmr6 [Arcicella sp. DC2W]MEA5402991.1 type III-B CRISPR module RAMP protein Cmr6 [Arcicella sp. DC2W]
MAKNKKTINDFSKLNELIPDSSRNNTTNTSIMDEYNKLWKNKRNDSFNFDRATYLPKYSENLTNELKRFKTIDFDNFALKLNKFSRWEKDSKNNYKFRFFGSYSEKLANGKYEEHKYEIREFYGLTKSVFDDLVKRHKSNAEKIFYKDFIKCHSFKPNWRVIVGLGTDSVYETGITLHHIYGFPYIPASAIKGITRSYIISEMYNSDETQAFQNKLFCDIFGCVDQSYYKESRKGKIAFFDAMPLTPPKIKPDIMNVHYPDYYGEGKAPTDIQNPNPIFFLTVEDTAFQFILGCKDKESTTLLETAFEWMKNALSDKGIGAKTAVGYGYFH